MPSAKTTTHAAKVLAMAKRRPLLRARELSLKGIPASVLPRLMRSGKLQRVSRGVYALAEHRHSEHRSLAEIAIRAPAAVICLLSALRVHEIGTQAPFEVWIAIPNNVPVPRITRPAIRAVRMSEASLRAGVERLRVDGVEVRVFNAAKTVADCFKFRNKVGIDVALEALKDSWAQGRVSTDDLWRYARTNRVANVMRPYLESIAA